MREDNVKIQMRKGIMEYCILAILANGESYAPAIITELKSFVTFAALKKNKWQDHVISTGVMLFISIPGLVTAFLIQYVLYRQVLFSFLL